MLAIISQTSHLLAKSLFSVLSSLSFFFLFLTSLFAERALLQTTYHQLFSLNWIISDHQLKSTFFHSIPRSSRLRWSPRTNRSRRRSTVRLSLGSPPQRHPPGHPRHERGRRWRAIVWTVRAAGRASAEAVETPSAYEGEAASWSW